jgi:hypothetical protein
MYDEQKIRSNEIEKRLDVEYAVLRLFSDRMLMSPTSTLLLSAEIGQEEHFVLLVSLYFSDTDKSSYSKYLSSSR